MEAKYTSERLEVFGSEYDGTLYVMPEGAWIGRGGSETFAILPENIHDREEKAAFIVRACNSHDALVEALKLCAGVLAGADMSKSCLVDALEKARAALALAGETP
jgi:hypothetical protein